MSRITTLFVGLDVHKDSISVAYAKAGFPEPPQFVSPIGTSVTINDICPENSNLKCPPS